MHSIQSEMRSTREPTERNFKTNIREDAVWNSIISFNEMTSRINTGRLMQLNCRLNLINWVISGAMIWQRWHSQLEICEQNFLSMLMPLHVTAHRIASTWCCLFVAEPLEQVQNGSEWLQRFIWWYRNDGVRPRNGPTLTMVVVAGYEHTQRMILI